MRLPRVSLLIKRASATSYSRARRRAEYGDGGGLRRCFCRCFDWKKRKERTVFLFLSPMTILAHIALQNRSVLRFFFSYPCDRDRTQPRYSLPPLSTHIFCPVDRLEIRYLASSLCHTFCLIVFLPVSGGRGLSDCMGRDNNGAARLNSIKGRPVAGTWGAVA